MSEPSLPSRRPPSQAAAQARPDEAEVYRLLMENVRDYAIFTFDVGGKVTTWNVGAERLLGYGESEIVGQPGAVIFTPDDIARGEPEQEMRAAAEAGRAEDERWHRRKDGSEFWASGILTALRDEGGSLRGYAKILRDMTSRREAEEAVRQQAEMLEFANDAILALDLNNKILFWNRAAESLYGWTRGEALGRVAYELLHTQFPGGFETVRRALTETGTWEGELAHTTRDGRTIIVSSRWALQRDGDGEPVAAMEINRDITAQREAEQTLRRHQAEIETLNERLHWAMTESHHRIKNNLQVIAALLDMQANSGAQTVPVSELRRLGQHVRALAAVHDLLTQQVKASTDAMTVSALEMLERLAPVAQSMLDGRGVELQVEDVRLSARQGTGLAILVNELSSNAAKHGAGPVHISLSSSDGVARLEVADGGPGFPPDFDPNTAANTGLQLVDTISRWDLQGSVSYGSGPQGGARVIVEFPLTPAVPDEPAAPASPPAG